MSPESRSFLEWLAQAGVMAGAFTPFIMAIVQGLGKFLSGTAQLIGAVITGLVFGILGFFGLWGVPASLFAGLQLLLFLAMCIGIPLGTYEAIKHAAKKAGE